MLGVEAWLAAPIFAVAGPSAAALKLPLLAINLGIAVFLIRTFERDMGVRPALAAVAALPVILPSVMMAAVFVDASGGSLEPYLWVLLLWVTRRAAYSVRGRPWHRVSESRVHDLRLRRAALSRPARRDGCSRARGALGRVINLAVAGGAYAVVEFLKRFASAAGPGHVDRARIRASRTTSRSLPARTCFSGETLWAGVKALPVVHWPALLGTGPYPLATFSIESHHSAGPGRFIVAAGRGSSSSRSAALRCAAVRGRAGRPPRFAVYLVLVGLFSPAGYVRRPLRRREPVLDALRTAVAPRRSSVCGMVPERPSAESCCWRRGRWCSRRGWRWSQFRTSALAVEYRPSSSDAGEGAIDRRAARAKGPLRHGGLLARLLHRLHDQRADDLRV